MSLLRKGLLLSALAGAAVCSYLAYRNVDRVLSEQSDEARAQALCLKSEFQSADVRELRAVDNHTHGESAAQRSTATLLVQTVAAGIGKKAYFIQGSGANHRAGLDYSRSYYWVKDLMCPSSVEDPDVGSILGMIDVDYYVDMNKMLLDRFQPYVLYTFVPSLAAKDKGDYTYRFLPGNKVEYHVSGGGLYEHEVWNWDGDSLSVSRRFFGITVKYAGYAIERRQIDVDHQLILLVPLILSRGLIWPTIVKWWVKARPLARFKPIIGEFVRFFVSGSKGMEVATGKVGGFCASKVSASVDSAIASTANTISGKLTLATVKSKMDGGPNVEVKNHAGAEVLLEYHMQGAATKERVSLVDAVRRFQWVPKAADFDLDAKPGMTAFMTPLLHGGYVPDVGINNERRFVDKRVLEVQCKELKTDSFLFKCMREFCELLVPVPHGVVPVDYEEVERRQNKPSQRAILREADNGQPNSVTKQFMKREAYGAVTDPRGISQINGVDKREYSRYMYAFSDDILKQQPWYAFGKSPREVADRVTDICSGAEVVFKTDFSRMDGRVSNVARLLEKMVVFRAFTPDCHVALYELMNKQTFLTAKTSFGITYKTAYQRLSGSPETSAFNTVLSCFTSYYTYRRQFMQPFDAWNALGVFGGDDGLSTLFDVKIAIEAASRIGQVLDLEPVLRGQLGVAFLARHYGPDVWYGDNNSCCAIKRQLSKFHLTVNLPSNVSPQQKLQEKAFSFYLTDKFTPVIGEFVCQALALLPLHESEFRNELRIWGVEMDADKRYPNRPAAWMEDFARAELADFDFDKFRGWLDRTNSQTILSPPRFAEPLPPDCKPGVVAVDDDIVVVGTPAATGGSDGGDKPPPYDKPTFRARKPKAERQSRKVVKITGL